MIALSTAHPAKFPEAVEAACGRAPAIPQRSAALAGKPERFDRLPADQAAVMAYIRAFAGA
jgi:threonine synthase